MAGSARRTLGPYGPRDEDGPPATARSPLQPHGARLDRTGGATGNERLTAATGAVLLVLFAAEGFTILSIHQADHGALLPGHAADRPGARWKAGAVCYRFVRHARPGPPPGWRRLAASSLGWSSLPVRVAPGTSSRAAGRLGLVVEDQGQRVVQLAHRLLGQLADPVTGQPVAPHPHRRIGLQVPWRPGRPG